MVNTKLNQMEVQYMYNKKMNVHFLNAIHCVIV